MHYTTAVNTKYRQKAVVLCLMLLTQRQIIVKKQYSATIPYC